MSSDSLASKAMSEIEKLITNRSLGPGDRLPSERELSATLGVSRGHVRVALSRLEYLGIVSRKPRNGVFVRAYGGGEVRGILTETLRLDTVSLRSLLELRSFLEVECASLAAKRASKDDLHHIESSFRAYVESTRSPGFRDMIRCNREFHLAIAHASGNELAYSLIELVLPDVLRLTATMTDIYKDRRIKQVIDEHTAIADAICQNDVTRAREAMEIHMRRSRDIAERLEQMRFE